MSPSINKNRTTEALMGIPNYFYCWAERDYLFEKELPVL